MVDGSWTGRRKMQRSHLLAVPLPVRKRNYCGWNGIDMPQSQLEAAMKLLGLQFECEEVRQVMKCLINKDEEQLRKLTSNPIKLTVPILEKFAENVREIDRIYGKKEIEYDK